MLSPVAETYHRYLASFEWDLFVTLTFPGTPSPEKARAMLNAWLNKQNRRQYGKRYYKHEERLFYAFVEDKQAREAIHYHLIIAGAKRDTRAEATEDWSKLCGGNAQVLAYQPALDGAGYLCGKIDKIGASIEFGGDHPPTPHLQA